MKTPLTVIMTNAELLQDEARRSTFSSSILTMSRQMRALVEQMLELARADSGQGKTDLRPVDLSTLVADALLPFEPVFFEQYHTVGNHGDCSGDSLFYGCICIIQVPASHQQRGHAFFPDRDDGSMHTVLVPYPI